MMTNSPLTEIANGSTEISQMTYTCIMFLTKTANGSTEVSQMTNSLLTEVERGRT